MPTGTPKVHPHLRGRTRTRLLFPKGGKCGTGAIEMAQRDAQWIQDRLAGKKLEDIAREHTAATGKKCSRQQVAQAIGRHLASLTQAPAEELRELESMRLDDLLATYWPNAKLGDMQAALFVLRVLESRRKLFGLDIGAAKGAGAQTNVAVDVAVQTPGPVDLTLNDIKPLLDAAGYEVREKETVSDLRGGGGSGILTVEGTAVPALPGTEPDTGRTGKKKAQLSKARRTEAG